MTPDATFVFEGTLVRRNASTVASVVPNQLTAVVRVDRVLRVPPELEHLTGQQITVQLAAPLAARSTTAFSTVGWVYGDSLAVIELEREPVADVAGVTPEQQFATAWNRDTGSRVSSASQIVLGQVVGMGPHPRATRRLSEHDADWWQADVQVDAVLKGARARTVPVTFANSQDVMWRFAPKLTPAQQAILVLHQGAEELPDRRSRGILLPNDVHAPDKFDTIAAMV
jgi:hypothetical protein